VGLAFARLPELSSLSRRTKRSLCLQAPHPSAWILLGGPGFGKTCTARLLADQLAQTTIWLEGTEGALDDLTGHTESDPRAIARRFLAHLQEHHPLGATLVLDSIDRTLDHPPTVAFLETWLATSANPFVTILTTRVPLPFPLARRIALGDVVPLTPKELRLDPDEVEQLLPGSGNLDGIKALAGWPLGLFGLKNRPQDAEVLLPALVDEELIRPLSDELRQTAESLSPLPWVHPEAIELVPGADPAMLARLQDWGILTREPESGYHWHPLAQRILQREWSARHSDEERTHQLRRMGAWYAVHDPEVGIRLFIEACDVAGAVGLIEGPWRTLQVAGKFDLLARWLSLFPVEAVPSYPELLLIEGVILRSRRASSEAEARFKDAEQRFRGLGNGDKAFEAMTEQLRQAHFALDHDEVWRLADAMAEFEPHASVANRVTYLATLAAHHVEFGSAAEGATLLRKVLGFPRLREGRILSAQQRASLTLALCEVRRGELHEALHHVQRVFKLGEELGMESRVAHLAQVLRIKIALDLGDFHRANDLMAELKAAPLPEDIQQRTELLRFEGDFYVRARLYSKAEAVYREALALSAETEADPYETAVILYQLAVIHRNRAEVEVAFKHHARAMAILDSPYIRVIGLREWAITLWISGAHQEAYEKLREATSLIREMDAPHAEEAEVGLALALAADRLGYAQEAEQALKEAVSFIRRGPYYYNVLTQHEIAADVWALLLRAGHVELLARVESLFPEEARAVRSQLEQRPGNQLALPPVAPAAVEIRCFGMLEVTVGSKLVAAWPRKKAKALLAHLLLTPQGLSRIKLVERLFPEPERDDAERLIGNLTSTLRKQLEPTLGSRQKSRYLILDAAGYRLDTSHIRLDITEFQRGYRDGMLAWRSGAKEEAIRSFEQAVELYRGDLFSEPALFEWFDLERHRYRTQALEMLDLLADWSFETGTMGQVQAYCDRALAIDPALESAHRRLMKLYASFDRLDLVRQQYEVCIRLLEQSLGIEPSSSTQELLARLCVMNEAGAKLSKRGYLC
jgi:DNA-binding SARP family transcriptional activator